MAAQDNYKIAPIVTAEEIKITGQGSRENPFLLLSCPNEVATLAILRNIQRWERGIRASWKIIDWAEDVEEILGLHRVRFSRRLFSDDEVVTERVAFYFDLSRNPDVRSAKFSPIIFSSNRGFNLPHDLAWLHLSSVSDKTECDGPFDITAIYSGMKGSGAIQVYGTSDQNDQRSILDEFDKAMAISMQLAPQAQKPWPIQQFGPMTGQFFISGSGTTFIGVAAMLGKLVKVGLTMRDEDEQSREMISDTMKSIDTMLSGHQQSWCPV